ncbi:3-ketoacyl-CoA thiolase [Geomicrobium sp. JCM 19037]|uniref:thiolase family protein n=1 Tax=Geomicrobium sp. JCM 19037 TaxID=1460634 RepID=UPI00045F26B7|nr:thiolase family protein [Geomicrobium sp. JCM 19037]GAK04466.1 3-ketoacyl-CoA thiolase [Geomicrobium sp. JCM 19037]
MREVVIVEAVRTPVGKRNGQLSQVRADELASRVIREVVKRAQLDPHQIEDVILGCVSQVGEQSQNIARTAALIAGLPVEVPGTTIDRQCGSSEQAVHFAAQAIQSGDMDVVIAGGIENMSRVPLGSTVQGVKPSPELSKRYELLHQGLSADRIADEWKMTRAQLDEYALESHQRAVRALQNGYFDRSVMPVTVTQADGQQHIVNRDEGPREDTSFEKLAALTPAFNPEGNVTAGNSSQISDGAGAMLIMSKERALALGFTPRFRIVARTVVGSDPTLMLTGPIPATEKVLEKARLSIDQIDHFEVNEAFASVPLAWLDAFRVDPSKVNPLGGAIALGHPLGASGMRLMITMMDELDRTGGRYGLQTMCEGNGMANATIIERIVSSGEGSSWH